MTRLRRVVAAWLRSVAERLDPSDELLVTTSGGDGFQQAVYSARFLRFVPPPQDLN